MRHSVCTWLGFILFSAWCAGAAPGFAQRPRQILAPGMIVQPALGQGALVDAAQAHLQPREPADNHVLDPRRRPTEVLAKLANGAAIEPRLCRVTRLAMLKRQVSHVPATPVTPCRWLTGGSLRCQCWNLHRVAHPLPICARRSVVATEGSCFPWTCHGRPGGYAPLAPPQEASRRRKHEGLTARKTRPLRFSLPALELPAADWASRFAWLLVCLARKGEQYRRAGRQWRRESSVDDESCGGWKWVEEGRQSAVAVEVISDELASEAARHGWAIDDQPLIVVLGHWRFGDERGEEPNLFHCRGPFAEVRRVFDVINEQRRDLRFPALVDRL
jgi:hypothetical protein